MNRLREQIVYIYICVYIYVYAFFVDIPVKRFFAVFEWIEEGRNVEDNVEYGQVRRIVVKEILVTR